MRMEDIYIEIEENNKKIDEKKQEIVLLAEKNINLYAELKEAIKVEKRVNGYSKL